MIKQQASREVADHPSKESSAGSSANVELADELAEARQRLAFYERFDVLIRDNVLRSSELLQQVAAEHGQSERKLLGMRMELDQRLTEQRSALEEIASGLAGLQVNLAAVGERVAASLARLGEMPAEVPVAGESPTGDRSGVRCPAEMSDEAIASRMEAMNDTETLAPTGSLQSPGMSHSSSVPTADATPPVIEGGQPNSQILTTVVNGTSSKTEVAPRRTIDIIVHGVPKAATALSLQRHLEELRGVETVDVREFVSGVLRFQMVATEFGPEDLLHWAGAGGLEAVTRGDNVFELRLVTADRP